MVIPQYWAESRQQNKTPLRQVTVRRWGWSDTSQEAAQALADQRATDALQRILSGETLRRREPKNVYGVDGEVPIREEVVSRYGVNVITRNCYGSLCLNTPNVFFADVDSQWHGTKAFRKEGCLILLIAGIVVGIWARSFLAGLGAVIIVSVLWTLLIEGVNALRRPAGEVGAKAKNLAAIRSFAAAHPDWHLRVYQTPAGFRLLAMHDVFDPQAEATRKMLESMNSDRRFVTLCALQGCFRARVSPKPWRIGYKPKVAIPKSKWPFPPEHVEQRQQWVAGYSPLAEKFSSCRFLEHLGCSIVNPDAEAVRVIHDDLCRATLDLPIA